MVCSPNPISLDMTTAAARDLAEIEKNIKLLREQLYSLEDARKNHPRHAEIAIEEAQLRRSRLMLPGSFKSEWDILVEINLENQYLPKSPPSEGNDGDAYWLWVCTLGFADGKRYVYEGRCQGLGYASNFSCQDYRVRAYSLQKTEVSKLTKVTEFWKLAKEKNGGNIQLAIASVFAYAFNQINSTCTQSYRLPWDIRSILCFQFDDS